MPTAEPLSLMVGEIFSLCIGPLTRTNYLEEIKLVLIFFNLFLVACAAVGAAFVLFRQRILFRIQEAVHLISNLWLELVIIVSNRIPKWFDCKSCATYGTSKHDKSCFLRQKFFLFIPYASRCSRVQKEEGRGEGKEKPQGDGEKI